MICLADNYPKYNRSTATQISGALLRGAASSQGWLQRPQLVAHLNAVHFSLPGVSLLEEFKQTVKLCARCGLIVNSRGCAACRGKTGREATVPTVHMDVDAVPQYPRRTLPTLLDALTTKVSVMQHVPKGFRIEWCDLLAEEINQFCEEQSFEAFALLSMLPKVILLATDRGGCRAKRQVLNVCCERERLWKEQEWHTLWNKVLKKIAKRDRKLNLKGSPTNAQDKFHERVLRLMADKWVFKAARELVSDGVHEVDQESLDKLRQLHPYEDAYVCDADQFGCCVWPGLTVEDDDLIREVVKQFSDASAGGPSQMLPVHPKEAMACGSDVVELKLVRALRRFVDLCASGALPKELSEFVTAANLIPLKKPSDLKDVRPNACGEVLRRVAEQIILRKHLPTVKDHLAPEQVGLAIS